VIRPRAGRKFQQRRIGGGAKGIEGKPEAEGIKSDRAVPNSRFTFPVPTLKGFWAVGDETYPIKTGRSAMFHSWGYFSSVPVALGRAGILPGVCKGQKVEIGIMSPEISDD
jgi:hypothetical protein